MPPPNSDSVLWEIFKLCSECMDANNSVVIKKTLFFFEKEKNYNTNFNLPVVKRLIELFAIEIEVKFGQNLNGSPTMCSIELLSKFMEINVVVVVDFNELHRTLKNEQEIIYSSSKFKQNKLFIYENTYFDKYVNLKWMNVAPNMVIVMCLGHCMLFKLKFVPSKCSLLPSQKTASFDWPAHSPIEVSFPTTKQLVEHTQTSQISQLIHETRENNINAAATFKHSIFILYTVLYIFDLFIVKFCFLDFLKTTL